MGWTSPTYVGLNPHKNKIYSSFPFSFLSFSRLPRARYTLQWHLGIVIWCSHIQDFSIATEHIELHWANPFELLNSHLMQTKAAFTLPFMSRWRRASHQIVPWAWGGPVGPSRGWKHGSLEVIDLACLPNNCCHTMCLHPLARAPCTKVPCLMDPLLHPMLNSRWFLATSVNAKMFVGNFSFFERAAGDKRKAGLAGATELKTIELGFGQ